ncbi:CHASE2 domain-containing protein [Parasphingorhabdus sp.]|uniref:CHASE2 domain-containing protein n=1 Tax=Parasphingorhabdus sp. TaxID=2709688 RepID=UPI003A90521B
MIAKIQKWWRRASWAVITGMVVIFGIAYLQTANVPVISPTIDRLSLLVFDNYQRLSPRPYEDAAVRILDIDDETIARQGQWPWPRTDIARMTLALGRAGAAAIAFDVVFSETDRTSPHALAERYAKSDPDAARVLNALPDNDDQLASIFGVTNTVAGFFLTNGPAKQQAEPKAGLVVAGSLPKSAPHYTNAVMPLDKLMAPAIGNGSLSIAPDSDSVIRRAPLIAIQNDRVLPSLSLDALRVALGSESVLVNTTDGSREGGEPGNVVSIRIADTEVPTNEAGEIWMHYTKPAPERIIPAWKLLSGETSEAELQDLFEGQIVFVGTSAIGLRDLRSTPLNDRELGVMIHAQAAEQMILKKFLSRPDWAVGLERALILIFGIGLILLLPTLGAAWGAALGGTLLAAMFGGSWFAFSEYQYLLNPTWPALAMIIAYLLVTVVVFYREERQRAHIHSAFDRYLAPELVSRIADDPGQLELGGEEREMTVLFCDIRSFTALSEKLQPNEIIQFLIAFLTPMTNILLDRKATIDKYIGDAILAFWNAPLDDANQHENAARGALDMSRRLKKLNAEMQQQSEEPWPGDVSIGIGLNSGPCCVGNMGSEQRLSYSLIGDTVNLASRIEGMTKYFGVEIAIGSSLQAAIPEFATLELDRVRVVGRSAPETLYVLLGDEELAADPQFQKFAKTHNEMLEAYRDRRWSDALTLHSQNSERAAEYRLTKTYQIYLDRIVAFQSEDPGSDWDGVFAASEK